MILNYWSTDWYYYLVFILLGVLLYNFNWNRGGSIKYYGQKVKIKNLLSRLKIRLFKYLNIRVQNSLNKLVLWGLWLVYDFLLYWNGFNLIFDTIQILVWNLQWFYYIALMVFFIIMFWSFKNKFFYSELSGNLRYVLICLFIIFHIFIILNNLFILLFLFECQSMLIVYFLGALQQVIGNRETYKKFYRQCLTQLTLLFVQFWAVFVTAIILIFVILWFSNNLGLICWESLNNISYFYITKLGFNSYYLLLGVGLMLLVSLLIKVGMFPFHFWKPELYKNLNLWGVMWYLLAFTFIIVFFILILGNIFLEEIFSYWYILVYLVQVFCLILLLNVIYSITEIKVFIAYMSIFHMSYIFLFFLIERFVVFAYAYHYLSLYIVNMIFFFFPLLCLRNKEVKYFTDFVELNQLFFWGCFMLGAFVALSGMPPFIGFWLKSSLIVHLFYKSRFVLAFIVFISGVYLMYFYLQNYRFVGNLRFTWVYISVFLEQAPIAIYVIIISCFFLNIGYLMFINEILNFTFLINFLGIVKW